MGHSATSSGSPRTGGTRCRSSVGWMFPEGWWTPATTSHYMLAGLPERDSARVTTSSGRFLSEYPSEGAFRRKALSSVPT